MSKNVEKVKIYIFTDKNLKVLLKFAKMNLLKNSRRNQYESEKNDCGNVSFRYDNGNDVNWMRW